MLQPWLIKIKVFYDREFVFLPLYFYLCQTQFPSAQHNPYAVLWFTFLSQWPGFKCIHCFWGDGMGL